MNRFYTFLPYLLILFLFSSCISSRLVTFSDEDEIMETFKNLDKTQTELFIKSQEWLVKSFKNAENVIQFTDKEEGVMMGRYLLTSHATYDATTGTVREAPTIDAVIDIRVKDDRARIAIMPQGRVHYTGKESTLKQEAEDKMNRIINDYRGYINGSSVEF